MRMMLDTFAQTLRTLWAHKLRSFLTMFGIAWGVGSLLLLAGVGGRVSQRQSQTTGNVRQEHHFLFWRACPGGRGEFEFGEVVQPYV